MLELAQLDRQERLPLDQAVTLDELVTMVGYAERLAIFFARCNAPVLRDRLIAEASRLLAGKGIRVVTASVPPDTANVRSYLRSQLASAQNGAGDRVALFVTDLEHSLPYDRSDSPVLTELNMGRELFHRDLPVPIVFWLPDYALTIVARQASDFWAWRSGVFDFTLDPLYRQQAFQQHALRDSDQLSIDNMTGAQKRQRRRILEGLLEEYDQLSDDSDVKQERTELLFRLAQINQALDDLPRAIEYYQRYLAVARSNEDLQAEGRALGNLGLAYADLGDARRAIEYYEQALAISREIGDRRGDGNRLGNLGLAYYSLGDARRAIEYHEQALVISREIGDRRGEGIRLGNLGLAYADLGEARRAIEYFEQALVISREIGNRRGEGSQVGNLGLGYGNLGDTRQAIEYFEQALVISREIGDRWGEGNHLANLGVARARADDLDAARSLWRQALAIYQAMESPHAAHVQNWLAQLDE